jgi:hypothetical protein
MKSTLRFGFSAANFAASSHPVRDPEFLDHFIDAVVRIVGADDHLQVRVCFPEPGRRLNAIPARRHSNIDEGHGIGPASLDRLPRALPPFPALRSNIDFEAAAAHGRRRLVKQPGFGFLERGIHCAAQDLAEILVDRWVIVDHKHSPILLLARIDHN